MFCVKQLNFVVNFNIFITTYLLIVGSFALLQFIFRALVADAVARHLKSINTGGHLLVVGDRWPRRRRPAESFSCALKHNENFVILTFSNCVCFFFGWQAEFYDEHYYI